MPQIVTKNNSGIFLIQSLIFISKQVLFYIKYVFSFTNIMLWIGMFAFLFLIIQESTAGADFLDYFSKKLIPFREYLTVDKIIQYYWYLSLIAYLIGTFLRKKFNRRFKDRYKILITVTLLTIGYSSIMVGIYMKSAFSYAYLYYIFIFLFLFHIIYTFISVGANKLINKGIDLLDRISGFPVKLVK